MILVNYDIIAVGLFPTAIAETQVIDRVSKSYASYVFERFRTKLLCDGHFQNIPVVVNCVLLHTRLLQ